MFGVKLLLIEDQEMIGNEMQNFLAQKFSEKFSEIHWTKSGREGINWFNKNRPEIVLLDVELPDLMGFEVLKELQKIEPRVRVLIVTTHVDSLTLFHLRQGGVMGVIDKNSSCVKELELAIERLLEWQIHNSDRVDEEFQKAMSKPTAFFKLLTPREQELMSLFGLGMTNEEIGEKKGLATTTVQGHRRNIMRKLKVKNASGLICYALSIGFVHTQGLKNRAHIL